MQSDRRAASDRPSLPETAPNKQEVLQASVNARVQRPAASSEAASRGPDNLDKLKHGEKRRKADAKYIKVRRLEVDSDATKPRREAATSPPAAAAPQLRQTTQIWNEDDYKRGRKKTRLVSSTDCLQRKVTPEFFTETQTRSSAPFGLALFWGDHELVWPFTIKARNDVVSLEVSLCLKI